MTSPLNDSLDRLIAAILQAQRAHSGTAFTDQYDPEWPSPCILETAPQAGETIHWEPVRQEPPSDMFARLSAALEMDIHPQIQAWYTRYWSDPLPVRHPEGRLTLLFCWNEADMERLRGNLLGHLLAKRKQRQPASLFFACTEGDEFMTLNNADGSIWLERPGRKPLRQLAPDLAGFLQVLTPDL